MLPVLPRYVRGPLDSSDLAVGVVIGSYAVTGLLLRPVAGRLADTRGRQPTVLIGALLVSLSGLLYLPHLGIAGLIVARLVLGAGEGAVYTAGSAWIVDLAPPERRGRDPRPLRARGLGRAQRRAAARRGAAERRPATTTVWIFAAALPLLGAAIAPACPTRSAPSPTPSRTR